MRPSGDEVYVHKSADPRDTLQCTDWHRVCPRNFLCTVHFWLKGRDRRIGCSQFTIPAICWNSIHFLHRPGRETKERQKSKETLCQIISYLPDHPSDIKLYRVLEKTRKEIYEWKYKSKVRPMPRQWKIPNYSSWGGLDTAIWGRKQFRSSKTCGHLVPSIFPIWKRGRFIILHFKSCWAVSR